MNLRHRPWALLLALLAALSLVAAACGDDDDTDTGAGGTETTDAGEGDGDAAASDVVLGGPPDCPTNPGCIPGLRDLYGVDL